MVAKHESIRKGKWTSEEEEYAQQLINYFNEGLLPLPPGVTLRGYLAERLNCDPMRITKKFTGSACLGKRLYHAGASAARASAAGAAAKAQTHLRQLEARFLNRVERNKDGGLCAIVELDPAFYSHPAIISTPAIDALIAQSRLDPNFWADHSGGESEDEDGDEEDGSFHGDGEAAVAAAAPHQQQQPQRQQQHVESSSSSYQEVKTEEEGAGEEEQQQRERDSWGAGPNADAAAAFLPRFPSVFDFQITDDAAAAAATAAAASPASSKKRLLTRQPSAAGDGHTDGSDCCSEGSDMEDSADGNKRPRWAPKQLLEREPEPSGPPAGVLRRTSSCSTLSTLSARTRSHPVSEGEEEEGEDDGHAEEAAARTAQRMLDVVAGLRKRGSQEDLVSFVCEVNQMQQPQQPEGQAHSSLPSTVVHCI